MNDKMHDKFNTLENARTIKLEKARLYAAATKPSLMPRDESDVRSNRQVRHPHSSLPARGVTSFGAKTTSAMLPPSGTPFLAIEVAPELQDGSNPELVNSLQEISKKIQDVTHSTLLRSAVRDTLNTAMEHICVVGDVVVHQNGLEFDYYRLDNFVIKRDVQGMPLELIVRQWMREEELEEAQLQQLKMDNIETVRRFDSNFYPYFIHVAFKDGVQTESRYLGNTQLESKTLRGTPWMIPQYATNAYEDYSTSLVEDNYGDIVSAHALRETMLEAMSVGNIGYIGFVPGSITADTLKNTPNWGVLPIKDESSIQFIQPNTVGTISTTASFAAAHDGEIRRIFFMDVAAELTQDRTTAYQVSQAIASLERSIGPLLNLLRTALLEPVAMNTILHLVDEGVFGPEVEDAISNGEIILTIKSGSNSMDSTSEDQKIINWMATWLQLAPEQAQQQINVESVIKHSAQLQGIPSMLLYSQAQKDANAQNQQETALNDSLLNSSGDIAKELIKQQAPRG